MPAVSFCYYNSLRNVLTVEPMEDPQRELRRELETLRTQLRHAEADAEQFAHYTNERIQLLESVFTRARELAAIWRNDRRADDTGIRNECAAALLEILNAVETTPPAVPAVPSRDTMVYVSDDSDAGACVHRKCRSCGDYVPENTLTDNLLCRDCASGNG